jgi:hypothetical protein
MDIYQRIKKVSFSANDDTGAELDLSIVPAAVGGETVYLDGLEVHLELTAAKATEGNVSLSFGAAEKIIKRVLLNTPWAPRNLVNARGIDIVREYRGANRGTRMPGQVALVVPGEGSVPINTRFKIQFAKPYARRARDFAIPAKLLHNSEFKVQWGAASDLAAGITVSGTATVYAVGHTRPEVVVPSLSCLESSDQPAGSNEPTIDRLPGRLATLLVARQNGALLASSEWPTLGLRFGADTVSEDSLSVSPFYGRFNEAAASTGGVQVADHTIAGAVNADDFLPILFGRPGLEGQRQTDMPDALEKLRVYTETATNGYTFVRRLVLHSGSWAQTAKALLGVAGRPSTPQTASHKGTASAEVASTLPQKAR